MAEMKEEARQMLLLLFQIFSASLFTPTLSKYQNSIVFHPEKKTLSSYSTTRIDCSSTELTSCVYELVRKKCNNSERASHKNDYELFKY